MSKVVTRRIIDEILNRGNIYSLEELVSKDVIIHNTDKELHGLDQLKQGIKNMHKAFPDLYYTVEDIVEEGNKITALCKGAGTHRGPFRGIPATGKKMTYTVILFWRFEDDKLAEHWAVSDVFGLLQQLNAVEIKK